jgi:hypothetical protein
MKAKLAAAVIAALFAVFGTVFALATPAMANQHLGGAMSSNTTTSSYMHSNVTGGNDTMTSGFMGDRMHMSWNDTGKMFGIISSIQNNEDGEPAWVVAGHWMMANDTAASNDTEAATNITDFHAGFYMTMLDGSAQHSHEIYNFTQEGDGTTQGNETTVTGTATVTLREGPVHDVPTDITISQGNIIAISVDQEATDGHFGDTPIYGMTITPEIISHVMSQMGGMGHMNTTTASTMMGNMTGKDCDWMQGNTTTAMTGKMWK